MKKKYVTLHLFKQLIMLFLIVPAVIYAQADRKTNAVFNSVELKEDTLQDYVLSNSYYTLDNNIDNPWSSVYISYKPKQKEILKAATRLPSDFFLVKKGRNLKCMILVNLYPEKYFLVIDSKTGEKRTFPWTIEGEISENRANEMIEAKYDSQASIENTYLNFAGKKLKIISNQETKRAIIQLIQESHLAMGDSSNVNVLSQKDLKIYVLNETKPGGKLDFFMPIKGKEMNVVQIKPGVIDSMIDVALYKWGYACFELGVNSVDEAYAIFGEYKNRNLNIRETTMIKDGFDKKYDK